jgi:hypothetical protein
LVWASDGDGVVMTRLDSTKNSAKARTTLPPDALAGGSVRGESVRCEAYCVVAGSGVSSWFWSSCSEAVTAGATRP